MRQAKIRGKIGSIFLSVLLVCSLNVPALAASSAGGTIAVELFEERAELVNSEGVVKASTGITAEDVGDYTFEVTPGQTLYLNLGSMDDATSVLRKAADEETLTTRPVKAGELGDSERFRMKVDKTGEGAGLVSLAQYNDAAIGKSGRSAWLQVVVANSTATEDVKTRCDIRLVAKANDDSDPARYQADDYATLSLTLFVQASRKEGEDVRAKENTKPITNGKNENSWADAAVLTIAGDQNVSLESVQLSTDTDEAVLQQAAEIPGAELFFRSFSGILSMKPGERATLTLKNPWIAQDNANQPNPADCKIYQRDADGGLTDITALFTYTEKSADGTAVNGWQMKTGSLSSYVISNKPLI